MKPKTKVTPDRLRVLPVWAQEHIEDLLRERDTAVRQLEEYLDNQTPSAFSVEELVSIPASAGRNDAPNGNGPRLITRYVQSHRMRVEVGKVYLDIVTPTDYRDLDSDKIEISWGTADRAGGGPANFCVTSNQRAEIKGVDADLLAKFLAAQNVATDLIASSPNFDQGHFRTRREAAYDRFIGMLNTARSKMHRKNR